jgi:hypothetical protein
MQAFYFDNALTGDIRHRRILLLTDPAFVAYPARSAEIKDLLL